MRLLPTVRIANAFCEISRHDGMQDAWHRSRSLTYSTGIVLHVISVLLISITRINISCVHEAEHLVLNVSVGYRGAV